MSDVKLPTYEEAARRVEEGGGSSLDRFICDNEPAGKGDEEGFRAGLAAVLAEARGERGQQRVFLLWEGGTMEGVITDHALAQRWCDSKETRGFTLELLDSPLRRETLLFKMGEGPKSQIVQSQPPIS